MKLRRPDGRRHAWGVTDSPWRIKLQRKIDRRVWGPVSRLQRNKAWLATQRCHNPPYAREWELVWRMVFRTLAYGRPR